MPDGLLDNPQQPVQQPMQQPAQPAQQAQRRDYKANPPNEQDELQMRKIVADAKKIIYSDKTKDKLLNMVNMETSNVKKPIEQIATASIIILDRIEGAAKKAGHDISDFAKINAGAAIVNEVISFLEHTGKVPQMSEDEKALAQADTMQKYSDRMIANGEITREELAGYTQDAINVTKKSGSMDALYGTPQQEMQQEVQAQQPKTMTEQLANGGGLLNV